jgi:L-cysteine S-thiosulfotransferase
MDGRQWFFRDRIGSHYRRVSFRAVLLFSFLILPADAGADTPLAERRAGYEQMSRETRAMQDDDATNPGMLWVLDGEALWNRKAGAAGKACADCHGIEKMKGVAARYPLFDVSTKKLINLDQRINFCRVEQQKAPALQLEGRELLALSAYIGRQSRGMPIEVVVTGETRPYLEPVPRRQLG